jgi:hypothetical protein
MSKNIKKGEYLEVLLRSPQSVFSVKDIVLLWGEKSEVAIRVRLSQYVKNKKLIRLRRGFYAKDKNYNRLELATKIYTPAYISFETVLTRSGVNFQKYDSIFVASYVSREIKIDGQSIFLVRMKDYVLTDMSGVDQMEGFAIASKERAFLDRIYTSSDYHFDNLDVLDWKKVFEILPIYNNKKMEKKVNKYFKFYNSNI